MVVLWVALHMLPCGETEVQRRQRFTLALKGSWLLALEEQWQLLLGLVMNSQASAHKTHMYHTHIYW